MAAAARGESEKMSYRKRERGGTQMNKEKERHEIKKECRKKKKKKKKCKKKSGK